MKISKIRRIKNKTNYRKRLILLKSKSPRLVIRKTNKYINIQIIESKNALDKVLFHVCSKELLKYGWPKEKKGSLKSLPAAYLSGFLLGKIAKDFKKIVILDTGLIPSTKGSRIYAAVKGAFDSGIKINFNEKIMPSKDRIEGKSIGLSEIFEKVKNNIK
ncbi:MAG: 50S ribosomal protein L18 [Candidatus Pacearchaeota archaeon]